jgi:hypothetical protein
LLDSAIDVDHVLSASSEQVRSQRCIAPIAF